MRKHVIRSLFVIVGAAIGFYYLPLLWKAINFKLNGASLVFIDLLIGALIFFGYYPIYWLHLLND